MARTAPAEIASRLRRRLAGVGVLAAMVVVTGCASLSREECLRGDWAAIGYSDGLHGRSQARLGDHFEACADHGVSPNPTAYRTGWASGVQVYCQPGNGFDLGASGRTYRGVCPPSLEGAFLSAYRAGRGLYEHRQAVEALERDLDRLRRDLDRVADDMHAREDRLAAGDLDPGAREQLHVQLRRLAEQQGTLRERRTHLRRDLDAARRELEAYRSHVRFR
ncbi:DUF2799 domain-containing protein [uncultured Rhodospira sp.]|uniref:DUF2799 domain-containing protein n=1 Tax=uncultured Rhodospira sp. TaxID=1936189 RepID=UPI00261D21C7|nr:DUF2799 domain-containing protein [uncultured Rhodospira sp.]